ncbi:Mpo1-like protein [Algoriphagus boritolerans]|uniref:Mpo1-like protein n=1 Tax=Algoriphagus boritolerans TaxID=308111 RepID=UPI002FCE1333
MVIYDPGSGIWICLGRSFFFFEKNKPATFNYPLYSLASDFLLFFDLLTGKEHFKKNAKNL